LDLDDSYLVKALLSSRNLSYTYLACFANTFTIMPTEKANKR